MKALLPLLLTGALLTCAAGCRRSANSNSVAISNPGITTNPVGPVPGAPEGLVYSADPFLHDPVALQDGRRLFNWYNCSGCHGGHAGGGMGPSLRDPGWLYGSRDDQIFDSISQGRSKGMPSWGTKIPQDQIWELVAYIKSMGTPDEPDPPIEPTNEQVTNPVQNNPTDAGIKTEISGGN
ncbi:MAG: c-type cytochrome [Terracidiphilus sp.]